MIRQFKIHLNFLQNFRVYSRPLARSAAHPQLRVLQSLKHGTADINVSLYHLQMQRRYIFSRVCLCVQWHMQDFIMEGVQQGLKARVGFLEGQRAPSYQIGIWGNAVSSPAGAQRFSCILSALHSVSCCILWAFCIRQCYVEKTLVRFFESHVE